MNLNEFRKILAQGKPIIWLMNIGAEVYWNERINRSMNNISNKYQSFQIVADSIMLLLCKKEDYVISNDYPSVDYLKYLESFGFEIPTFIVPEKNSDYITKRIIKDENILGILKNNNEKYILVPFASTKYEEMLTNITGIECAFAGHYESAIINSKIFSRNLAIELGLPTTCGEICNNESQTILFYKKMIKNGPCVVKNDYGASGLGMYVINNLSQLEMVLNEHKKYQIHYPIIIEKWYSNCDNYNYQFYVDKLGNIHFFSVKQQILKTTKYIGSNMLSDDYCIANIKSISDLIGKAIYKKGYWGVISIDAIKNENGFIPIIEINGRMSLSTYISFYEDLFGYKYASSRYYDAYFLKNQNDFLSIVSYLGIQSKHDIVLYNISYISEDIKKCKCRLFLLFLGDNDKKITNNIITIEDIIKKNNYYYAREV